MANTDRHDAPKRKLPLSRIVAWTIVAALLGAGGYYHVQAVSMQQKIQHAAEAEPLRMKVDLSKPGRYEGAYHQTYMGAHGANLGIHLGPAPVGRTQPASSAATEPTTQLAADFEGEVQLFNGAGERVFDANLSAEDMGFLLVHGDGTPPDWPCLRLPAGLPRGTYRFVLDVRQPAAELTGRKQTAIARYMLCGLEGLPAFFVNVFSAVLIFLGVIMALVPAVTAIRRRKANP